MFKREVLKEIEKWLYDDKIIFLNWARQVWKTSILKIILENLKNEWKQVYYLNLEDFDILQDLNNSTKNLLNYISNEEEMSYFFIDEIQYLDNPSNFLKYLYDEHKDKVKLFVTGSSNLEIKARFQDSLVWRKIDFYINPLNFKEFLEFKKIKEIEYFYKTIKPLIIQNLFINLLNEYLLYWWLPAVVLENDLDKKKVLLKEYVNTYINKDIRSIGKIDNLRNFNNLVKVFSVQIWNMLNISELTNTLNISRTDVQKYIDLLQNTFILNIVNPYFTNIRSQVTKSPKLYFFDIWIRNQILWNFLNLDSRTDSWSLFENFIYLELINKYGKDNIYFYRTTTWTEIDFIVKKEVSIIPIEVKYKTFSKSINISAISHFNSEKWFVINLNLNEIKNNIEFIDFTNFISKQKS